jgi:hypothetical protein
MLNYARSDTAMVRQIVRAISSAPSDCVAVLGITHAEAAALAYHGNLNLKLLPQAKGCQWLVVQHSAKASFKAINADGAWKAHSTARRRSSNQDDFLIFKRQK